MEINCFYKNTSFISRVETGGETRVELVSNLSAELLSAWGRCGVCAAVNEQGEEVCTVLVCQLTEGPTWLFITAQNLFWISYSRFSATLLTLIPITKWFMSDILLIFWEILWIIFGYFNNVFHLFYSHFCHLCLIFYWNYKYFAYFTIFRDVLRILDSFWNHLLIFCHFVNASII